MKSKTPEQDDELTEYEKLKLWEVRRRYENGELSDNAPEKTTDNGGQNVETLEKQE